MPRFVPGWNPDRLDYRDKVYRVELGDGETTFLGARCPCVETYKYPRSVDLRGANWPGIYDQGQLGSCVEHAWCAAMGFVLGKEGVPAALRDLSKLFLYYNVRGGVPDDTGSTIRDGIKSMAKLGDCRESTWPYDLRVWAVKPPKLAYDDAIKRKGVVYARLKSLNDMLHCLSNGYPVVYGMTVYEAFELLDQRNNVLPMPTKQDTPLGGHALCMVGYDKRKQAFLVRNSWGTSWGDAGYFWLPFDYATNRDLSDDFWTVRTVPIVSIARAA